MRFFRKYLLACVGIASLVSAVPANAAYIVQNARLARVTNTDGNQTKFAVLVADGTGPCAGQWIQFPLWAAPDADTHKRAYAALLMALATGMKVTIYNYTDDSCTLASYVEVLAP
jgi:hypothetical protein